MVRLVQRLSLRWQPRIAAGRQLSSRPAHWDKDPDHLAGAKGRRHEALAGWIKEVLGKPVHRSQEEQGKRHFWLDREMRAQGHSAGPDDSLLTLLRSVLARKGPLKATAWFLLYCSSVTAAFENARYASFTDETMMSEVFDEVTGVVQYVMTSQNVLQGCTGFLATALFMTLSFRINRAASRWWHGREVWARLLGQCRALSQTTQLSITDKAMASELSMLGYAFVRAAEFHVRAEPDERFTEAFGALLPPEELQGLLRAPHRPFFLSERLSARLADAYDLGFAKNVRLVVAIQRHITNLVQAMEGRRWCLANPPPIDTHFHHTPDLSWKEAPVRSGSPFGPS
ncbi:unnamed protein product [Effrenium voratum]|nr:unnamed protein product [Effrenium voratum]